MVLPKAKVIATPTAPLAAPVVPEISLVSGPSADPGPTSVPGFRAIYDEHFTFVWRLLANRGVPVRALEDVAQEVFIVVHRKLPEFEGRSTLRTWIAAIARRVIADYAKKRGNRAAADESLAHEPPAGASPAELLEQKAALELLDALLGKMPEEQREVFVLHEIERMSGAEIAQLTHTNQNTVWTRLRAARRTFQQGVARAQALGRSEQA